MQNNIFENEKIVAKAIETGNYKFKSDLSGEKLAQTLKTAKKGKTDPMLRISAKEASTIRPKSSPN